MKTVVWIGRFMKGGFAPGARRNAASIIPYIDKLIVAPLYVLPPEHELYPYVEYFDEDEGDFFKVVNHLPTTDPTADAYYSVFEYDKIPLEWREIFNDAKLIMTESNFCKEIILTSINDPNKVHLIPYILPTNILNFNPKGASYRPVGSGIFLFGSIFDWVPRKVPERTIIAFLEEFNPNEPVKLMFRTTPPDDKEKLKEKLGDHYNDYQLALEENRIIIVKERIEDIVDFYRGIDAYISATAGEGYGQTLTEAMACGVPTIGSNHSGNLDFMNADNSYLVEVNDWSVVDDLYGIEPSEDIEYNWKLPKISSIKQKMRQVYEERKNKEKDPNIWWARELREQLTPEIIGKKIYNIIKQFL